VFVDESDVDDWSWQGLVVGIGLIGQSQIENNLFYTIKFSCGRLKNSKKKNHQL